MRDGQKFESFEQVTKSQHGEIKTIEVAPCYRMTYGEVVAPANDDFGRILEVCNLAAVSHTWIRPWLLGFFV